MGNKDFMMDVAFNASRYAVEKRYWLNKLAGQLVRSSFPCDFNKKREEQRDERMAPLERIQFNISGETFEKLMWTVNNSDLRLFMVLVTGIVVLLGKHTGQEDIIVGTSIEKQEVEGNFLNTLLALRAQIDSNLTFKELLLQVRQTVVEAIENQNFPIERIPYELDLEDQEKNVLTLFDTAILLENLHDRNYIAHIPFNMVFSFFRTAENIEGVVEYNSTLYEEETVQGIIGHLVHLFREVVSNLDLPINKLEILPETEREFLLVKMNNTRAEYPKTSIHELFQNQVEKTPENIAVEEADNGRTMTYKELNRRANRLAYILKEKGIVSGVRVAVIGERTADIVVSILAILKGGGVLLPLDGQNPDERLHFILEDSGTSIIISQERIIGEREFFFKGLSRRTIIAMDDESIYKNNAENPHSAASFSDSAYIIYTSGTTGKPKGVMVEHKSLVNYIRFATVNYVKEEKVNFPLFTSIAFDMTITSIFTPLVTGNAVVVYSGWNKGNLIERIIDENKVGVVKLTPSHLYLIGEKKLVGSRCKIRRFVVGGEVLKYQITRDVFVNFNGQVEIYNEYGPTEATVGCMLYKFDPLKNSDNINSIPIGIPAANTQIYLLDKNRQPVPIGAVGEIHIGGDGLARGYLNRPELTSEKFLPFAYSTHIGRKLYRTGDLARFLKDRNIEFLGRVDHQVKIRGFRVELGEIESRFLEHKTVKEAIVTITEAAGENAYGYKTGSSHICAYFVSGTDISTSELRAYLSEKLPDYMIPSYFVRLDAIPLTPNGKVDLKALPEPEIKADAVYIAPQDETEKKLVRIWSEILGLDPGIIGVNANFFELGGHSLSGTVLIAKIHKSIDVKLALADLFRLPTIRELAQHLKKAKKIQFASIEPVEEKEYYPLSSAQERFFVLQKLEPRSIGYNVPATFKIEGELPLEKIHTIFQELIRRHENYRTSFILIDDKPVQKIHKNVEFELDYFEVSSIEPSQRMDSEIQSIINQFIRPFDLSRVPLIRVGLIRPNRSSRQQILLMDIHHIITDGVSVDIMLKEIGALYNGHRLSPLKLCYKDFSEWQNSEKIKMEMKKQEAYWLKQFEAEAPVLELPTDFQRPVLQNFEGNHIRFNLDNWEVTGLRELAASQDVTLFMLILSLFNIFLAKVSGQEDIVIGSPIAGRRHTDLQYIMGLFINTLALRNHPSGEKVFLEFLQEIKISTLNAYENQEYQYEELVTRIAVRRDTSRNPLLDAMFALNNVNTQFLAIPKFEIPDLSIIPYNTDFLISKVDIMLNATDIMGNIFFEMEYSTKLFKEETVRQFIGYFRRVITGVLANPLKKLAEVEILAAEEKKKILIDFNETETGYPKDKTIRELFEEQVEQTPDNIAVVASCIGMNYESSQHITYKELNKKSNRLAHALQTKGVGPDTIVGIMIERSVEMIIGIMGILKAGGAYMPIDPEFPGERIDYMLKDSSAVLLVTTDNSAKKNEKLKNWKGEKVLKDEILVSQKKPKPPFTPSLSSAFATSYRRKKPAPLANQRQLECGYRPTAHLLAYVIYTSGTTGHPKGTIIEHQNIVRLMMNDNFRFDFSHKDTWTFFHSFCFDFSVWEMYGALLYGGKLVVIPQMTTRDMERYLYILKKMCVTVLNQTPSAFYNLSDIELSSEGSELATRYVIFGGEALTLSRLREWKSKYPATKLINMYGITETTVHVTFKEIQDSDIELNISNIGKPIPTLTTYVMDKNLKLLPLGVAGELVVGGKGVGRGYLNRPDLTREKFVDNPYKSGERLYKSGDLVKWLSKGDLQYLGRIDNQVKIRGFRIELGEIENRLLKIEGIREAVVLAWEKSPGEKYICAYIVSDNEYEIPDVHEFLSKELPKYMIPSYFVRLEKIPLTPNGKVDRKALPSPEKGVGVSYIAPRDKVETKLAEIWADVLVIGKENIGIETNFFDIGGHSLKATILVSKIHKEFDVRIPLAEIFLKPHIIDIAEYIRKAAPQYFKTIEPIPKADYYDVSHAQKRLWVLAHFEETATAYMIMNWYIFENLNRDAFEKAVITIVKRHETLRTTFISFKGEPKQKINDYEVCGFSIAYADLGKEQDINKAINSHLDEVTNTPFNLEKGPLLRITLLNLQNNRCLVAVAMHHIISDGWSMQILKNEILTLYTAYCHYKENPLPPLKIQYKDFAAWQNREMQGKALEIHLEYWKKCLDNELPVLNLETDFPRPPIKTYNGRHLNYSVNQQTCDGLISINSTYNVTFLMTLAALLIVLFHHYSGQEDIVIGLPVSGRDHAELENQVGFYVNIIPLRVRFKSEDMFETLLISIKSLIIAALEHQSYPFDLLVEELGLNFEKNRSPLFDVVLQYINFEGIGEKVEIEVEEEVKEEMRSILPENNDLAIGLTTSKFDLVFNFFGVDVLYGNIIYNMDLFERQSIDIIIEKLKVILQTVAANPRIRLDHIDVEIDIEKEMKAVVNSTAFNFN